MHEGPTEDDRRQELHKQQDKRRELEERQLEALRQRKLQRVAGGN